MSMGARIEPKHLPKAVSGQQQTARERAKNLDVEDFSLDNMERRTIMAAIEHYNGNILQAAKALGIGRNTLYAKMRKYQLS